MKIFHRVLVQFTIGILVLGMASIAVAAPISKRTPAMGLQGEGFGTIEPSGGIASKRSNRSSAVGCWNRPNQGTDLYVVALDESYVSECSPKMDGETAWMYAPGCANLKSSKNRLPSGHCSADDELVTNLGNLVVHSSDQMLGRVDVASHIYGAPKSLPAVASVDKEGDRELNAVKSSMRMDQALVATAFRFDRMGQEVFDGDEDDGEGTTPEELEEEEEEEEKRQGVEG